jgi:Protein of unknown function (DUF3987)/Bifunctional DNA primase/polymerase, N-terminal/Primase C terminal 1 (PriCT-1)
VTDDRPDELLEQAGRTASRLRLAVAWTDSIRGQAAKECTGTGSAAWKAAKLVSTDASFAAGFYRSRCRARNPAVVASASGLVLLELDGPDELLDTFGIATLPATVEVQSRRGKHRYLRPPAGRRPLKVQLDEAGVIVSSDGYVVSVPALHPSGHVYRYLDDDAELAELPVDVYDLLIGLGRETRARTTRVVDNGGPIPIGQRNETIFHLALEQVRADVPPGEILERLLEANQHCVVPLDEELVRKQLAGAIKWARQHPTETEKARAEARRILQEQRVSSGGRQHENEKRRAALVGSMWERPVPFAARGTLPPFPVETLLDWAAAWATAIAAEKGATVDLSGNLILDVVAGAIARNVQVSPRPGWYEPTNLYTIVALAPGQRKSPVFKAALRPVRTLEQQLIRAWEEQEKLVTITGAIFDKRRKGLIDEAADDELDPELLRERLGELLEGLGPTETPPRPRLLTEDVTPEGLAGLLADHGRIIAASDEGGAIVENLAGRYARGSTSWDVVNKGHSSVDLVVDRKSSGPVIVFDPTITLAIATQPELLRTLAGKPGAEGRGVLARPLYVLPAPVYVEGATPAATPETLDEYARRVLNVYNDTPELETDEDEHPRPTLLTFDDDARALFERFEAELNRERRELGGDDVDGDSVYLGWLSKLAGQTARLGAVLHAADHWTAGAGTAAVVIDEATVARAVELARYYRAHALAVFGLMGELPEQRRAQAILRWLQTRSPEELEALTVRDVHRTRGKGTTAAQVQTALRLLEQHGYVRIERVESGKRGRPAERVHVHPEIKNPKVDPTNPTKTGDGGISVGFVGSKQEIFVCERHPSASSWRARDGHWRCTVCEPPVFRGEVLEEREA